METPRSPFSYTYTPSVPEILGKLGCTLAISTFQTGKVILISANGPEKLVMLPRTFERAMGMALEGELLAIASKYELTVLMNAPSLAGNYPKQPGTYDALFVPRASFYTGDLDIHDIALTPRGLITVNTRFSCLALVGEHYSFAPVWQPPFVTALTPDDRCHLNGLAMMNGEPRFVTALGRTDSGGAWRDGMAGGGILMDVSSNEILASDLPMPHSPLYENGKLYLLLSATGEVVRLDLASGMIEPIIRVPAFVRGLDKYGDFLFVGLSKIRESNAAYKDLPIAKEDPFCGVAIIHEPSGQLVGQIRYEGEVKELYGVKVLPGMQRPGILNTASEFSSLAVTTPTNAWWAIAKDDES